jgi:hypothetical protein
MNIVSRVNVYQHISGSHEFILYEYLSSNSSIQLGNSIVMGVRVLPTRSKA